MATFFLSCLTLSLCIPSCHKTSAIQLTDTLGHFSPQPVFCTIFSPALANTQPMRCSTRTGEWSTITAATSLPHCCHFLYTCFSSSEAHVRKTVPIFLSSTYYAKEPDYLKFTSPMHLSGVFWKGTYCFVVCLTFSAWKHPYNIAELDPAKTTSQH